MVAWRFLLIAACCGLACLYNDSGAPAQIDDELSPGQPAGSPLTATA